MSTSVCSFDPLAMFFQAAANTTPSLTRPHLRVNLGEEKFEECGIVSTEIGRWQEGRRQILT